MSDLLDTPDALAAFFERVTDGEMPAAQTLDLVNNLIAGPDRVRVFGPADGQPSAPHGAAILMDTCGNAADAAELNLAFAPDAPNRAALAAEAFAWADAVAARGPRTRIDVALFQGGPSAAEASAAGYVFAYGLYHMRAEPLPTAAQADAASAERTSAGLPPGFAWRAPTLDDVPALYETTLRSFADIPGAFFPPLDDFTDRFVRLGSPLRRILTDGRRVAAFVRCAHTSGPGGDGMVQSLGRHPDFTRAGLGPQAMALALSLLRDSGAGAAELDVVCHNDRALSLYRAFGFAVVRELHVHRKVVPPRS